MVDRLRHEVVGAAAKRPDGEVVLAVAGDQKRRRSRPHPPDLLEQREAVHPGHLDAGHDRVVIDFLDPLERIRARLRGVEADSLDAEQDRLRECLEQRDVVVDEQDPASLIGAVPAPFRSSTGASWPQVSPPWRSYFVLNGGAAFSFCALSFSLGNRVFSAASGHLYCYLDESDEIDSLGSAKSLVRRCQVEYDRSPERSFQCRGWGTVRLPSRPP